MLFSATVHNSLVHGLLVKHLVQHKVSGHHVGDNTVKRLTECHFQSKIPFTEKKWKSIIWCFVYSKHVKTRDSRICFTGRIVMLLCALMGVLIPTLQGKIIDKMKLIIYYI
jgi:hypothetical protein